MNYLFLIASITSITVNRKNRNFYSKRFRQKKFGDSTKKIRRTSDIRSYKTRPRSLFRVLSRPIDVYGSHPSRPTSTLSLSNSTPPKKKNYFYSSPNFFLGHPSDRLDVAELRGQEKLSVFLDGTSD